MSFKRGYTVPWNFCQEEDRLYFTGDPEGSFKPDLAGSYSVYVELIHNVFHVSGWGFARSCIGQTSYPQTGLQYATQALTPSHPTRVTIQVGEEEEERSWVQPATFYDFTLDQVLTISTVLDMIQSWRGG